MMLTQREVHSLREWAEGIRDGTVICPSATMAKTVLEILDYVDKLESALWEAEDVLDNEGVHSKVVDEALGIEREFGYNRYG
jgi:hypothetical protein